MNLILAFQADQAMVSPSLRKALAPFNNNRAVHWVELLAKTLFPE